VSPPRGAQDLRPRRRRGRSTAGGRLRWPTALLIPATLLITALAALVLVATPAPTSAAPKTAAVQLLAAQSQTAAVAPVWVTRVEGIIDPALSSYLVNTMERATKAQAAALVIEIDTPGGLDTAMRDIIQAEIDAPIPIVFYVYPQGARAASAGVYILMGADVAAMAPQTNLGAATPVSLNGEMDDVMKAKVTNDAAAYIKGLATTHGRNAVWAEQAVRQSVSLTAEDAERQNVIEFVVPDLPALLQAIDGYVTTPKGLTLHTAGVPITEVSMGWVQRFLHAIANPDIAYILMTIGILGIILEFTTPGLGVSGIAGVICLLLAFYAFQVLPVSLVGIALVLLAMILYVAEIKIQSHGILGIGGTAALIAGGLLLFNTSASFLRVSWPVLVILAAIVLAFFLFVVRSAARAMRRPHATGAESLVGTTGIVISSLSPQGQVRLHGEIWRARAERGELLKDQQIEVLRTEGLTLIVRQHGAAGADTPGARGEKT
jgi:membrane-bound serine protease (ClpP class)